jgi:hypothetical protein
MDKMFLVTYDIEGGRGVVSYFSPGEKKEALATVGMMAATGKAPKLYKATEVPFEIVAVAAKPAKPEPAQTKPGDALTSS